MAANQAKLDLSITGMTCGSCVRHVTDALREVDGVEDARVDLRAGRATVSYSPGRATAERLIEAVEEAGYEAALSSESGTGGLSIRSGCGCSSCG